MRAKTEMEKQAESLGISWKGTGDKRMAVAPPVGFESPLTVFGHQADKVGNIEFIERKGTPLDVKPAADMPENTAITSNAAEVARSIGMRKISLTEFLKKLRSEIGVIAPAMNADLRARYEQGIDVKESEEVIRAIADGTWNTGGVWEATG
jgi:hypothetical protein